MGSYFRICTIANDLAQYETMRYSFEAAGFTSDSCRFVLLDNSVHNRYDAYRDYSFQLDEAKRAGDEMVILCHQDVRADRGHNIETLTNRLEELSRLDPRWAVAGNAGHSAEGACVVGRVSDPVRTWNDGPLPGRVVTLDENFLVVRPDAGVRFTGALHGFHLYATDLCLQAAGHGRTAYAIDFHLTHLSGGNPHTSQFAEARHRFQQEWNRAFWLAVVHTPSTAVQLSRSRLGRWMLRSGRVREWLVRRNLVRWPDTPIETPSTLRAESTIGGDAHGG